MDPLAENEMTADREIIVSRTIDGPQHLVFEAYTEVRHLSQWWGPNGFTTTTHAFEFRPGGRWHFTMHGPDGTDYPNLIEWLEITPPERIEFRHGTTVDDPDAFTGTVTIRQQGDRCLVTLRSVFQTRAQRDKVVEEYHAIEGAKQTLARLAGYVLGRTASDGGR